MSDSNTEDILCTLLAARLHLMAFGWHRGLKNFASGDGPVCVMGAVHAVAPYGCYGPVSTVLAEIIGLKPGKGFGWPGLVGEWNDRKGRTKADVLKAMDRAIARLEREMDS